MSECEYPGCNASDDTDGDIHTYGFTVDGLTERERDYCGDHAPSSEILEP